MASEGERGCSKLGKMRGGDEEVVVEWMSRGNSACDILAEEVQGRKEVGLCKWSK